MQILQALLWSSIIGAFAKVPWTILLYYFRYFRLFHITSPLTYKCLQNRFKQEFSIQTDKGKGYGYTLGWCYILYLSQDRKEAWIFCSDETYRKFTETQNDQINIVGADEKENDDPQKTENSIVIYERMGDFCNSWFRQRKINIMPLQPRPHQLDIITKINDHYEKYNRTVCYISGPPNAGKSIIGLMLATRYESYYCNSFKPWQPGDLFGDVYIEAEPSKEKPLVVVLDEVDIALLKIHVGIPQHSKIPISVYDKQGWNSFFDEIHWGMYPFIIMLLISNKPDTFIDDLDSSYLREGRVDLKFDLS